MKSFLAAIAGIALVAAPAWAEVHVNVQVQGLPPALKANVLASLSIAHYENYGDQPEASIRRLDSEAPKEIRRALQPFGYFSPQIDSTLKHEGDNWTAIYRVDPGPAVKYDKIDVTVTGAGSDDPAFRQILANLPIHAGERLLQSGYSQTKQLLQEAAAEYGYLDAQFTRHQLRVNPKTLKADVEIIFDTGPQYRFGKVRIHQSILQPGFVQRYVHIKPGDTYNAEALANLQGALSASGYFSSVTVNPDKNQAQDLKVPIDVNTTPARRNLYRVGLGYGTDTGPRFRFDWENRRVNSKGHRFKFDTRLSHVESQASARYIVPLRNPETDHIVYSATLNKQDYGDTVSHLFGLGANRISRLDGWQTSAALYENRYTSTIGPESWTSHVLMPELTFSRIVAHPPNYPRRGFSINATFSGSARALTSDVSFLRADLNVRLILPLGPGRLLLHGEAGAIAASDFSRLPVALRFYAGGDNSVRGYAYQSIGPRNANGLVVGGRYLKVASVEYDLPIVGNWGLAGFLDAGNASNTLNNVWNKGIGIGVRYRTPVGAIRVDFAHPISHPELSYYRIHISIGLAL